MAGKCGLGRKREIKSRSSINIISALGPSKAIAAPPRRPALSARLSSCRWACLAAARGLGRPGLRRSRRGGLACPIGACGSEPVEIDILGGLGLYSRTFLNPVFEVFLCFRHDGIQIKNMKSNRLKFIYIRCFLTGWIRNGPDN